LPKLTDSDFHDLHDGDRVTTDDSGEALLRRDVGGKTCKVYVFFSSTLVKRACPRSSYTAGNTSCLQAGSAVYRDCSNHLIMTPSSEVFVRGSWISVTYRPEDRLTLVAVVEGEAEVRPVVTFDTRELGDPIFVFPGQMVAALPDVRDGITAFPLAPLYPPEDLSEALRYPLPLVLLPQAAELLQIQGWVERVEDHAQEDGVSIPGPEPVVKDVTPQPYPEEPVEVGESDFQRVVLESPVPVLVDFSASWCVPCLEMEPVLQELAWVHAGELVVARVDTEIEQQLGLRYDVQGLPTYLFFRDGAVVDRVVGFQPVETLQERIDLLLGWSWEEAVPTGAPPTEVPPTEIPPTQVPPTAVPPTQVPPTEVPPTEAPPTEEVREGPVQVLVEMGGVILQEPLVQEAVAVGVDWLAITPDVFSGEQSSVSLVLQGELVGAHDITYDPSVARGRLDEAGYVEGFKLEIVVPIGDKPLHAMAEAISDYLAKIGVQVESTLFGETIDLGTVLSGSPTMTLSRMER
jgi:thioredoxin 1